MHAKAMNEFRSEQQSNRRRVIQRAEDTADNLPADYQVPTPCNQNQTENRVQKRQLGDQMKMRDEPSQNLGLLDLLYRVETLDADLTHNEDGDQPSDQVRRLKHKVELDTGLSLKRLKQRLTKLHRSGSISSQLHRSLVQGLKAQQANGELGLKGQF